MSEHLFTNALLQLPDAELLYLHPFLPAAEAGRLFEHLLGAGHIAWRQDSIRMFGKQVLTPRLSAWYGVSGAVYTYSGLTLHPLPFTPALLSLKEIIEQTVQHAQFNSVLLNLYRNGADSMGWHADDEPELGSNPVIASVSLGAERRFLLRHKYRKELKQQIVLQHNSLLIMRGTTQHFWQHALPKTSRPAGARINLTFRHINMLC
ncbi:alpha-ketoglutarate-dependent dioxygenase AlkB [Sphingobacteriales bacterium UPWRP_1]|nr:hypothetical protein BVG80_14700 [Sphingobacteriales bacterium TSM_CSM]PSJ76560.1 alpha-ketoglutarate-dependent dioxygenase AlkB [Sphingobacteriales bacterium UPWRP_1]